MTIKKPLNKKPIIDISWWQDPSRIDYDKLARGIDGAIIRIGYSSNVDGTPKEDKRFKIHYEELTKRGIPVGGYWYSTAVNKSEVLAEVRKTLEIIEGLKFELPIAWDTEDERQTVCSKELLTSLADTYCSEMERVGYYVMIYSFSWWLNNRLNMDKLSRYDTWVADLLDTPSYNRPYGMWQYTWKLRIEGYDNDLDGNHVYKDYPSIMERLNLNGFEQTETDDYITQFARDVIRGEYGNGVARKENIYKAVQKRVDELLKT